MTAHGLPWSRAGYLLSLLVAFPAALAGCHINLLDGTTCAYEGAVYEPGDSFPDSDGCNSCSCMEDGQVACTLMACVSGCVYEGDEYSAGESFPASDGCNTCTCDPSGSGSVGCTKIACQGCAHDGVVYDAGDVFTSWSEPDGGGCGSSCVCGPNGEVTCTPIYCPPPGCIYGGEHHAVGDAFRAEDGCNTCVCVDDGSVACTEEGCTCDPASEWGREYVGGSLEECQLIDFICYENTTYFANACGCGCEQDASCPEFFDCMPPAACDEDEIKAKCPFSGIAY